MSISEGTFSKRPLSASVSHLDSGGVCIRLVCRTQSTTSIRRPLSSRNATIYFVTSATSKANYNANRAAKRETTTADDDW
uniref:Uncharacterized protein n=1 Tax=Parascaris equorum TaxID=6256 RepID=A0A914RDH4_PAREQ